MEFCPCGSEKSYDTCCALYIQKKIPASTPEQLMRSRYTAYSLAQINYIEQTMKGKALVNFHSEATKKWAEKVIWVDLKIIAAYMDTAEKGFVEFIARFIEHNQLKGIHELSEFQQENKIWFYVDGMNKEFRSHKINRNAVCPCGSGRKFKNCHAI